MKILILGLNYAPEKVGVAVYSTGLAEYLSAQGHEVRVIAGQPYYPSWRVMDGHSAFSFSKRNETGVKVRRVPHYIPANPSGAKRLAHHASFAIMSFFPMLWSALTWRPDVVFTVAPSLISAPIAKLSAVLCNAKAWLHIQDFEVEAAFATGLLKNRGWAARLACIFERIVLGLFSTVSTISPQMCGKLIEKGVAPHRIVEFRNWADTDTIFPVDKPSSYRAEWGIAAPHVALYAGNISNKQGIEIIVEAARLLKHRSDLTFVICGEGPNRKALEARAADLGNIEFHDLQPKQRLNDLMNLATIHLLPQKGNAADIVMPSKLINMLASGRPVVATAAPGTGLADEVEGCGIVTPPEDAAAFAKGIEQLMDGEQYSQFATQARSRAEGCWPKEKILNRVEHQLRGVPDTVIVPEDIDRSPGFGSGAIQPDPDYVE